LLGQEQRAGPADVLGEQPFILGLELRICLGLGIGLLDLSNRGDQMRRQETASELAEEPVLVGMETVHGGSSSSALFAPRTTAVAVTLSTPGSYGQCSARHVVRSGPEPSTWWR